MSGMNSSDAFLFAMSEMDIDEDRCKAVAVLIGDALDGFKTAEGLMGLCYHLNGFLNQAPRDARPAVLAGIMRLIDPDRGNA